MTDSPYPFSGAQAAGFSVILRRSARRKRSIAARVTGRQIVVSVPSTFNERRESQLLHGLLNKVLARQQDTARVDSDLRQRCVELADQYLSAPIYPHSVRWVTNQAQRWGSCTHNTREIRISHRLQGVPAYVLDAVLFHEVIHLLVPAHNREFKDLEALFPRLAEANAFLRGYSHGLQNAAGDSTENNQMSESSRDCCEEN